ncbi:hypothetical protein BGZ54_007179 [Gamsiella multidivaricata]|nr:hypothetical protein BGZ54_007179 [Gamsiella multidivaricata]
MDPFSIVRNNLPSLPLLQRRSSSAVVNVVVQSSPTRKHAGAQPAQPPHPPHAPTTPTPTSITTKPIAANPVVVTKPRSNPQAILPELEKNDEDMYRRFASRQADDADDSEEEEEEEEEDSNSDSDQVSIHTLLLDPVNPATPTSATFTPTGHSTSSRKALFRHSSFHTVQASAIAADAMPPRASMDSYLDRARVIKPSPADTVQATTMVSRPRPPHLRHIRSSSTPAFVALSSPLLNPSLPASEDVSASASVLNIPAVTSEPDQKQEHAEVQQKKHEHVDSSKASQPQALLPGSRTSASANDLAIAAAFAFVEARAEAARAAMMTPPMTPKLTATPVAPSTTSFASAPTPVPEEPKPAPIITPVAAAPSPPPSILTPTSTPSPTSIVPAPSSTTTLPPTTSSFLSSWHGRSRSMISTIPRPSPLMSFRAARSVVSSVTSVGTGLLPSKEQLGAIPVAGRILNHPVMDSTLSYIATKASERGISLAALTGHDPKKMILPEDVPYRQLNKKMIQQAMTLSVLAVQKEEQSKMIDDEAADDAFELYLMAVNSLLHALPFETCDPLRREAFETQVRDFLEDQLERKPEGYLSDDDDTIKRQRRRRRRRHRHVHEQAATLIQQHTAAMADPQAQNPQPRQHTQQQRKQRREQYAKQQQALKKQQLQLQQQQEKEAKLRKQQEKRAGSAPPSPALSATSTKSTKLAPPQHQHHHHHHGSFSRRRHRSHRDVNATVPENGAVCPAGGPNANVSGGIGDTIISTAVHSAIRLKQSPIPDVVKSCLRTSKTIFHKVDERFHLQDKAWELSKQSIEKAIELDEQYAIHEVVTETVFATITGLVRAGIAYKESPSYTAVKAATAAATVSGSDVAALEAAERSHNPQEIKHPKKKGHGKPIAPAKDGKPAMTTTKTMKGRKALPTVVESNTDSSSGADSEDSDFDSGESDSEATVAPSISSSSSTISCASSEGEDDTTEERDEELIELNQQTLRSVKTKGGYGSDSRKTSFSAAAAPYAGQMREKIDMFMALKGAASLIVGNL